MAFVEECWIMSGLKLAAGFWVWRERHVSVGTAGSVDFDWEKAWDNPLLIGWRHTHPGVKFDYPSSTDDRTMRSWVRAGGKSMICGVTCGDSTRYYLYYRASKRKGRFAKLELRWRKTGPLLWGWRHTDSVTGEGGL